MKVNAPFKTATGKSLQRFMGELRPFRKEFVGRRIRQSDLRFAYNARFGSKSGASSQQMMVLQAMGLPQAMVKVVRNSGTTTGAGLKGQLAYLSRESKADSETLRMRDSPLGDHGADLTPEALQDKIDTWVRNWRGQPALGHTTHMIVSYPKGTDPEAAREAALEFAERAFQSGRGGDCYDFVSVQHLDTDHPHTHFVINNRGMFEGRWFTIQRDGAHDVNDLRALQVETASAFGIALCATRRLERGLTEKPMLTAEYRRAMERQAATWGVSGGGVLDTRRLSSLGGTAIAPALPADHGAIIFEYDPVEGPDWDVGTEARVFDDVQDGVVQSTQNNRTAPPSGSGEMIIGAADDWGRSETPDLLEDLERPIEATPHRAERAGPLAKDNMRIGADGATDWGVPDDWDPIEEISERAADAPEASNYAAPTVLGHRMIMVEHAQRCEALANIYDQAEGPQIADLLRETAAILRQGKDVHMDRREMTQQDLRAMERVEGMKAQLAENIQRGDDALARDPNPQTSTLREIRLARIKGKAAPFFPERDDFQAFGRRGQEIDFVQDAYRFAGTLPPEHQAIADRRYDQAEADVIAQARSVGITPERVVARYQANSPIPAELARRWGRDEIDDIKRARPDYTDAQAQRDVNTFHRFVQRQYADANRDIAAALRARNVTIEPPLKRPDVLTTQDRKAERAADRKHAGPQKDRSDDRSR